MDEARKIHVGRGRRSHPSAPPCPIAIPEPDPTRQVLGGFENIRVEFWTLMSGYFRVWVGLVSSSYKYTFGPFFFFFLKKVKNPTLLVPLRLPNSSTSLSSSASLRIVEIFCLAVTRFKGNINLWFQFLEFCRLRRNRRMKKANLQATYVTFH